MPDSSINPGSCCITRSNLEVSCLLSNLKLTREPVLWASALLAVAAVVTDYLNKGVDLGTAVNLVVVALGGLVARTAVTPNASVNNSNEEPVVDGIEEVSQDPDWSL